MSDRSFLPRAAYSSSALFLDINWISTGLSGSKTAGYEYLPF